VNWHMIVRVRELDSRRLKERVGDAWVAGNILQRNSANCIVNAAEMVDAHRSNCYGS
jgi:hypothetical protein